MFTNPTLFTCPFCPEPTGEIFVDADACLDQRGEDPDPLTLRDGALDDPQSLIRFGRGTARRVPCPHVVFARGTVVWFGQEGDAPKWEIDFDWTPPSLRALDRGIGAIVLGDPEQLAELGAALKPRVRVAFGRPAFSWDALADFRNHASVYRGDAVFVAAADPLALRSAVEARVEEIQEFGRKLKQKAGGSG